jgi:serine protease AprX
MARRVLVSLVVLWALAGQAVAADHALDSKLDPALLQRAHAPAGTSQVIVRTIDGRAASLRIRAAGGLPGRHLSALGGQVARIPDAALHGLASLPEVSGISLDRPVVGSMQRTAAAIGARWVTESLGLDGAGVGIALIDSGVSPWHDDLDVGRIVHFADFIDSQPALYDDYGHGTHVAGIIAGNGRDSDGQRRGIAPGADLIVLKALDAGGGGYISNVIAAVDYAIAHRQTYNIRIINLSVSAGVYESYHKDPLTLAAKRAVDAGIVVVAAAGNFGRDDLGGIQYGGIAAPGNAPWVLTVGASSHNGTVDRTDDGVAAFSSRGPAAIDRTAKPDLVAPGVAIQSLAEPSSVLFATHPTERIRGTVDTVSPPYLALSGTSMSAPVVAATVALMLEANPDLTPNAVKAILQFTAESHPDYDHRTQGAGFLNARGAVQLARSLGHAGDASASQPQADPVRWSRHIVWNGAPVSGGTLTADANAWKQGVIWGASATPAGDPIVWGTLCAAGDPACRGAAWAIACDQATPGCAAGRTAEGPSRDDGDEWLAAAADTGAGGGRRWR